jgi:excisionase family DNA binding protein
MESKYHNSNGGPEKIWLTTKEAARYLNCHPNTLEKMRVNAEGPPWHRLGKKAIRYLKTELCEYMLGGLK